MIRTLKDVKPTLKQYFALLDVLRARRGAPGWKAEQDRQILAQLDDWYMLLSQADQDEIESQGTRAWPELHGLLDRNLDAADDGAVHEPPRVEARAA